MKALVVSREEHIDVLHRGQPPVGDDEVLIEVGFAAICHTDHFVIGGGHPLARYPIVPGHEISGTIAALGNGVCDRRLGDRVAVVTQIGCNECATCVSGRVGECASVRHLGSTVDGGWQEHLVVPQRATRLIPSAMSTRAGALVEPAANAHALVGAAHVTKDDTVVVLGPGPIGLLALQFALLREPSFVLVAGLPGDRERLRMAAQLGAHDVVAAHPSYLPTAIRERVPGNVSVVFPCAPSVAATATALAVLDRRGRLCVEGYAASDETVVISPDRLVADELTVCGVNGWALQDFDAALAEIAAGRVEVDALVTHEFRLDEFRRALAASTSYAEGALRVVFRMERS
jgi:L-iditol 2-dehydrogenase